MRDRKRDAEPKFELVNGGCALSDEAIDALAQLLLACVDAETKEAKDAAPATEAAQNGACLSGHSDEVKGATTAGIGGQS